jgi:hypothetical protein
MNDDQKLDTYKRTFWDKVFTVFWFGGVILLGVALPIYFTITNTGTAAWLIKGQEWFYTKLIGSARWHPVATGIITAVIHLFVILGIIKGISMLTDRFKKKI